MSTKKKVLENSFLYIFSSILVKAMEFLLLPIYTLFLTPEEYGVTNLVMGFINVATFIISFSLYSAIIRFYADYKDGSKKLKRLNGTIISFIFMSGVVSLILGFIFRDLVIKLFFEGIGFFPIVFVAFLILIFISLHTLHRNMLQAMQQGKKLVKINLVVFIATAILKILFIGVLNLGPTGFLLALLIVNIVYSLFMVVDLKKNDLIEWTLDLRILKETLKYSIPLIPHDLSTRFATFISRVFINVSGTLADVGLYSIGMQFGGLIDVVQVAVNKAFQPWFFEEMKNNEIKNKMGVVNLSNLLLIFYSLIYMGMGLFSQEVVILMTNDHYMMAWTVIPILVVGFSIKSIYYFYVNIVMFFKQAAKKLFIATISGSFMNIILAYILVPYFGMYGSAVAFVLSKIITVAIVVYISKSYTDIGYSVLKMLRIILPSLLFMMAGLYFSYTKYLTVFSITNLAYKILIMLLYILFIYITNKKRIDKALESGNILEILKRKKNFKNSKVK